MRALLALPLAALALAGCAKFPANGAQGYTRLVFRYTLNGPVNPNYRYIVAIRVFRNNTPPTEPNDGPIPVVTTGSKNGFVEGSPTHYVEYVPDQIEQNYAVHRFATKAEAPDNSDTNPINLGVRPITGPVLFGVDPRTSGNPNQLGFDITTQDLATNRDAADARSITGIQFNILTMNRDALTSAGDRSMDALGDSRGQGSGSFNDFRGGIYLTTGNTYRNPTVNGEPQDDVYNVANGRFPAIDITDWTLEVRTQ